MPRCKKKYNESSHTKYNHSCTVYVQTLTSDNMGGYNLSDGTATVVFVEFWKQKAAETVENLRISSPETITIELPYIAGIDHTQNIKSNVNGRVFDIKTVINDKEENRKLLLMCRELVDAS